MKQRAKTIVKSGYGDKAIRSVSEKVVAMTKAEKAELLNRAVGKLDEAATILSLAEEQLLCKQVTELADLIHVEIGDAEAA